MASRQFEVTLTLKVIVEVNEALLPTEEWRETFYDFYSLADIAGHIAWNKCAMRFSDVEGLVGQEDLYRVVSKYWEVEEDVQEIT